MIVLTSTWVAADTLISIDRMHSAPRSWPLAAAWVGRDAPEVGFVSFRATARMPWLELA